MNIPTILKNAFIPNRGNNFKPRFLHSNWLLYVVLAIILIKALTLAAYLPVSYNFFFADVTKTDLVNLLNQNRQALGLGTLTESEKLNQAAYLKAQDMVQNGYFAHQSPSGVSPWFWFKKAGYNYKYAGENLAVGFVDSNTVYDAWFNSPSHKENLLNNNYTQIGTAVVTGFQGNSIVVVQLFGKPLAAAVASNSKSETLNPKQIQNSNEQNLKPVDSAVVIQNDNPQVLAETTQQFVGPEHAGKGTFYLRFLNFIIYDNNAILRNLSLGVLAVIVTALVVNGILMSQVQNRISFVRPLLLIAILCVSLWLNKGTASHAMPYQIFI